MIYTFYSYKGGVGRSMALANIAELLYESGLRVVMVDWDLEAPGLERYFWDEFPDEVKHSSGIMDLVKNYKKQVTSGIPIPTAPESIKNLPFEKIDKYLIDIHPESQTGGKLKLLTAGNWHGDNFNKYSDDVINFNWRDFYKNWGGEVYIEWLRIELERLADVVLIDSRTGLSEMGGICTYQLSDTVVMFCTPNLQNIKGTYEFAKRLRDPEVVKHRANRPLNIMVLPSRVEHDQPELYEIFHSEFTNYFTDLIPESNGINVNALWELGIPYIPKYAFHEGLAVREREQVYAKELFRTYLNISEFMRRFEMLDLFPAVNKEQFDIQDIFNTDSSMPLIIVISGPAGVGKDTIYKEMQRQNLPFHFVIPTTTRPPKRNEVNGEDYFFISEEDFIKTIEEGEFLVYGIDPEGDYFGFERQQVEGGIASSKDIIMRMRVDNAETIRKFFPEAILIFLTIDTAAEEITHFLSQHTKSPSNIIKWITNTQEEMSKISIFDFIVKNESYKTEETVAKIVKIIESEHLRVHQRKNDYSVQNSKKESISFGNMIKELRRFSMGSKNKHQSLTREDFARRLSNIVGSPIFTINHIENWETGKTVIGSHERYILVAIVEVFHHCYAINSREEADLFLSYGKYSPINDTEAQRIDQDWVK